MTPLDRLLNALPPWVLVVGKGGVGKTTGAGALALRSAARGAETLLLSTDPAGTLGDLIGMRLAGAPAPVSGAAHLQAMQLDAAAARDAFLAEWRDVLVEILDRGTYLAREDAAGLVDETLPGIDESMALLTLLSLERDARWQRVVVDTAPTGHTLRLLALPRAFRALVALLDAMQEKHRFMVRALAHRYRPDRADAFIARLRDDLDELEATFRDARRFATVLMTRNEPVVREETRRYAESLRELGIAVGAVVVNATIDGAAPVVPGVRHAAVPLLRDALMGLDGVARWGAAMRETAPSAPAARDHEVSASEVVGSASGANAVPIASLTIVAGKGGVGKTTIACAIALRSAASDRPTLVVSTDPAPSVADVLEQRVGDEPVAVAGAPGLFAQQLDATAAFARFRDRYAEQVDAVFANLLGGGMDATFDRRIARELLALAPPGIDEVYALAALGEALAEGRWAAIIVDPAPTGHLLRLLAMPELAVAWSHRLLRLMLKYRELMAVEEAAREVTAFARRTRALAVTLHDPGRAGAIVVALDETLVRGETERLAAEIRAMRVGLRAVIMNRVAGRAAPLPALGDAPQFEARERVPAPRGVAALRAWARTWTRATRTADG